MVPGVAPLDRSPDQSLEVGPISPSHYELRGTRRGGPSGWSTDQVGPGVHTLEWIFSRTCLQGLSLTVGKSAARGCTSLPLLLLGSKTVVPHPRNLMKEPDLVPYNTII